jgi:hypothetical protein
VVTVVDLSEVRGLALAKAKGALIRHVTAKVYFVPSQTSGSSGYVVDAAKGSCTCPDFEERGVTCKHQWALRSHLGQMAVSSDLAEKVAAELAAKTLRPTYRQNWPAYNRAQCEEKDRLRVLLGTLCDGIAEPVQVRGRPRVPLRDAIYCAAMKVFTTLSGRRATVDLRACEEAGHVARAPSYNSIFRVMDRADLQPLLKSLVEESAKPLRAIEKAFAADSTGFGTCTYGRWTDHKYGGEKRRARWIKAHAMVGTVTNIITAIEVTESYVADSVMFEPLVQTTAANGFTMREVSADKAYLSHENLAIVERVRAVPFIPL